MFTRSLFCGLVVWCLLAPAAQGQAGLSLGLSFGAGGPDGGRPESFLAASGGGVWTLGSLVLKSEAELGAASWTDGGGRYAFDPELAHLRRVEGPLCQDLQTGRYVPRGSCESSLVQAAVSTGASWLVPYATGLSLGAGYRAGYQPTPYAAIGYLFGAKEGGGIRLGAQVSQRYTIVGASFEFGL